MLNYNDHIRAQALPWKGGVEIAALRKNGDGSRQFATIQWENCGEDGYMLASPLLSIRMEQAQILMDDLWSAGIRPTEGSGSAGAMRAAERHIEDLRAIAFKVLEIGK